MTSTSVSLWVRSEPFSFGVLPAAPHPRLSLHNIKKIVSYAKSKGKLGFPRLSFSVWRHIACNKLQIPEDLAWMYFVTYDLVCDTDPQQRAEWDQRLSACTTVQALEHVKSAASVPTLQFVLFLFMQHLHKISLKSSMIGAGSSEEWPMRSRSPDLESVRSTGYNKNLDEQGHLTFVLNNFNDILELLVEPESFNTSGRANDLCLTMAAVEALAFIIVGSPDSKNHSIKPLHELATLPQVVHRSGYSKLSCSFNFRSLQSWIRSKLELNPFGVSCTISMGRRLIWPFSGEDREVRADNKNGRICSNGQLVPRAHAKGNKLVVMSQVCKQTVARGPSGTLENSSVKIHRCHYSQIYLLTSLRSASIEKSRHSTVVIGSVETTLQVSSCRNLTVITTSRRVQISGSSNCTLYLLTPTRPLILGGNDSIILAPYNSHYPQLEEHMHQCGIRPTPNNWHHPLTVGPEHNSAHPVWQLMAPGDFAKFVVPFEMSGNTTDIPGGLPAEYSRACIQRERVVEHWQQTVQKAGLNRTQRKQFQKTVEDRFQDWLLENGHRRTLEGLVIHKPKKSHES